MPACALLAALLCTAGKPDAPAGFDPAELRWEPDRAEAGAQRAPLWGPTDGEHADLLRAPARWRTPSHQQPVAQRIVVVSGTLSLGGRSFGPGAYVSIPAESPYSLACRGGCVVMRTAEGPLRAGSAASDRVVPVEEDPKEVLRFENAQVRAIDVYLEPGVATRFHEHRRDRVYVVVEGSSILSEAPGQVGQPFRMEQGLVGFKRYEGRPTVHRMTNAGKTPLHIVAFDLLAAPAGPWRESLPVPWELLLDKDRVRAYRIILAPGAVDGPMPRAHAGVRIAVTPGRMAESVDGDSEREFDAKPGDERWRPAGSKALVRNLGPSPLTIIELQFR